jgi:hypothetical protein
MLVEEAGEDVVVTVGEDGGRDLHAIIEEAAGGLASAVDLRLDLFDDDSLAAFDWFHLNRVPGSALRRCVDRAISSVKR